MPRYIVRLTEAECLELEGMLSKGRHAASKAARARILLKADAGEGGPGWNDGEIVKALDVGLSTVYARRSWGPGWRRRCTASPAGAGRASWTASRRRGWSPWPAAPRRRGGRAGR